MSEFSTNNLTILAVHNDYIELSSSNVKEPVKISEIKEIKDYVSLDSCIVLVAADESISHHQIMALWDQCREAGFDIKLGAIQKKKLAERMI